MAMHPDREYFLKWHSFSSTIQGVFQRLLENSAFADVTLSAENQTLPCHRLVLSACSTYFENILTNHPGDHPIIILLDIPHRVMVALVKFMYCGEIRLPQDQLQSFLKAAETLRIKGLTETEGVPGRRLLDSAHPPPLIPATPCAVTTPLTTSTPIALPSTAWIAPVPATKRRTPEPAAYDGSPPHDLSAKRRKPQAAAPPQQVYNSLVHVKMEESELESESDAEPLSLTIRHEPARQERQPEQEEEEINVEETGEPDLCVDEDMDEAGAASAGEAAGENGDEDELEEEAERAAEEAGRRLEEDIELVSGESTADGPPESPPRPEQHHHHHHHHQQQQQVQPPSQILSQALTQPLQQPPQPPHQLQQQPQQQQSNVATVQAASEAAASTLMSSCGGDVPWKDPRWTSLLPEEKVMEAMGNMLDVPTLAAKLMKNLFTEEERINSNTTGDHGKQIFDKEKMDLIKSIVFHVSKISEEDQFGRDDLWVRCKMKIDKWNRDLRYRYARKKKDKDTSLPTMVKMEYAGAGRDDDPEREPRDELQNVSVGSRWPDGRGYSGVQSPPVAPELYSRKKKDKDASLPTMVKLEYAGSGRDDEWEGEPRDQLQSLSVGSRWADGRGYGGIQSPPVASDV